MANYGNPKVYPSTKVINKLTKLSNFFGTVDSNPNLIATRETIKKR